MCCIDQLNPQSIWTSASVDTGRSRPQTMRSLERTDTHAEHDAVTFVVARENGILCVDSSYLVLHMEEARVSLIS